ncbi:choice-of-anchor L domain-containing protein [Flavobacterium flavipallidum]|uniref:Choice-of-anchor L domain-containing protein n=1 Tax=Flavobacterium flavipallidum TaxID=3139140 RepID=A0ABU9HPS6_9FLAO
MKVYKAILFCCILNFLCSHLRAQIITIDDTKNAAELVSILTNNSSCLEILNQSVSGNKLTAGKNSYGTFTNNSSNFPFQSGIILSTGNSSDAIGPFIRNEGLETAAWPGDTDLNQILNINSINATVLEFDFIPTTNGISFNYFFASNEYQDDYPCFYSDGFAFLIKEKASTNPYQNLAVIPQTTTTVSSFNIHPKINFKAGCQAKNESYFGQFNNTNNNNSPINFAGQTKVFNAKTNVTPGKTYHIKLVIADDKSYYYDSAIFIEAASFNSAIDLGTDRLLATNSAICFGENYIIDTKLSPSYNYKWYKDGILQSAENNPSYIVTAPGTYKVEVTLSPSSCSATNQIKIEYTPEIILNNSTLTHCNFDGDGKDVFNLTEADDIIKNNNSALSDVTYFENLTDAKTNSNPIPNPTYYTNQSLTQTLIAKVTNSFNCANYAELTLNISNTIPLTPITIITAVETKNFEGNKNSATIKYSGTGNYEFSIDGNLYQNSPVFLNIPAGNYIAYARDKNSCENAVPYPFFILDYPRFFTPNGDGFNDTWTIKNLNQLPPAIITIFDRYGKLLKQFNSQNLNWEGTFNGVTLPSDDYWFNIISDNKEIIRGNFSLKR